MIATKWLDTRFFPTYIAAPIPRTSGTTAPLGRTSITCLVPVTATFSDTVDSKVTTTPTSAQDTPRSGGVVEELAKKLEGDGERIIHHDPSKSLALGGEYSAVLPQAAEGDEHYTRLSEEEDVGHMTAAAVLESASQEEMLHHGKVHGWVPLETRRDATNLGVEDGLSATPEWEEEVEWDVARDNKTQSASPERHVLTQVTKAPQKAQCKVVYFAASIFARAFRERYDALPNVTANVDPVFTWTDPAEPILQMNLRLLGTTILDSHCPFLAPHIIINSPPPQAPELTANNATPYEQDATFGQRLIVFVNRHATEVINKPEYWSDASSSYSSYGDELEQASDVDHLEGLSEHDSSPAGTPMPETPIDDDGDDHRFFFARHGDSEDGHGHDGSSDNGFLEIGYSSVYPRPDAEVYEGGVTKLKVTSRPMFFIDEDEDELPSLDDW
ncbi:hypothetical protein DXG03_000200 [Asterophora parasitica]|uniref:Uncharacterized protein n=1 Tax=Asterophora parasitica TaxID=117018 RepID=A0A9P7KE77_9AGAR|nr:hypothetical protein DXG03_000200 [Asterophora parasitica]